MTATTYTPKAGDITHNWYLVDASDKVLGRLATKIATILRGKHKPMYTPHADTGDYVVVINSANIKVTGNKAEAKQYYRHSGYPGGIKSINFNDLQEKKPTKALELAVKRMLPRGPLGRAMFRKLKVYSGASHPHEAQQPQQLNDTEDK